MKKLKLPNVSLAALVASCFIQIGAQLFALVVVASMSTGTAAVLRNVAGRIRLQ